MTGETFRPLALFPPWLHPHHIKVHVHQQVFHDLPLLKFRFVQNSWSHDCFGSWFAIKLRPWRQSELGSDDDDDDDGLNSPKHIILVPSLLDSRVVRKYQSQLSFLGQASQLWYCVYTVWLACLSSFSFLCWSLSCAVAVLYFSLPVEYEMIVIIPALQRAQ